MSVPDCVPIACRCGRRRASGSNGRVRNRRGDGRCCAPTPTSLPFELEFQDFERELAPTCPAPTHHHAARCSLRTAAVEVTGCVALRPLAGRPVRDEAALRAPGRPRHRPRSADSRPPSSPRRDDSGYARIRLDTTPGMASRADALRRARVQGDSAVQAQPGGRHEVPRATALRPRPESARSRRRLARARGTTDRARSPAADARAQRPALPASDS